VDGVAITFPWLMLQQTVAQERLIVLQRSHFTVEKAVPPRALMVAILNLFRFNIFLCTTIRRSCPIPFAPHIGVLALSFVASVVLGSLVLTAILPSFLNLGVSLVCSTTGSL
jgi:hypothetical protein